MKKLQNTLSKIKVSGITTKDALSLNAQLYYDLFIDVDQFITGTVFRSHTNIMRLSKLRELGVDIEDVHMNCLERVISKLDLVLANELEHQIPYMYTIGNYIIISAYRDAIKGAGSIVSLDEALNSNNTNHDSRRCKSLNDYIVDTKASPETKYIAKAAIIELYQKHCNNADNLLCVLASKVFEDKASEVAALLIREGSVDKALAVYEYELSEIYGVSKSDLPTPAPAKATGLSRLLSKDNLNSRTVANKVSNILNRIK